jgi:hypothetical protein
LLIQAGINLLKFSKGAAQEEPLLDDDWNERTLLKVFSLSSSPFELKPAPQYQPDSDCGCYHGDGYGYLVEISWVAMLEQIRKDKEVDTREERKERKFELICKSC